MSRKPPLRQGQLVVMHGGEPAFTLEIACRYPDILLAALTAFMRPGAMVRWIEPARTEGATPDA